MVGGLGGARRLVARGNTNTSKGVSDLVCLLTLAAFSQLFLDFIVGSDMKQLDEAKRVRLLT